MNPNDLINKFNSLNKKTLIHIKDLQEATKYEVKNAKRVTSKYGTTVQIELENNIMYLPNRYNALSDDDVMELATGVYYICKQGDSCLKLDTAAGIDIFITNAQYPRWE